MVVRDSTSHRLREFSVSRPRWISTRGKSHQIAAPDRITAINDFLDETVRLCEKNLDKEKESPCDVNSSSGFCY